MSKIKILGKMHPGFEKILTKDAQNFLIRLHEKFNSKRLALLKKRYEIQQKITAKVYRVEQQHH